MGQAAFREISLLIAQMRRLTSASLSKRLAIVGTSLPAYKVLFHLMQEQEASQHELAADASMDPAAISRLIQTMVRDGYVTTRVHPTDKRQRFVKLTRRGRELEQSLSVLVDAAFEPFSRVLTEREQQQLLAIMRKACDGVNRVVNEFTGSEPAARSQAPARAELRSARTRRR
jgi:DNA-binding MarR family transcriptional regulator